MPSDKSTPLWKTLTDEQVERVRGGTVRLRSDSTTGLLTATRTHDGRAATGRSPRQAIEALDKR